MNKVEQIKAEIERRKGICMAQIETNPGQAFPFDMEMTGYDKILFFIDTLPEDEPSEGLDFQTFASEISNVFALPKERTTNTKENPMNWEYEIARHFYELGLNARKED